MPKQRIAQIGGPAKPHITCEQVTALILDYLSGDLDQETVLAFRKHLRHPVSFLRPSASNQVSGS